MNRLLITTGDADGIGSEITAKALTELGPQSGFQFVLFRSEKCPPAHLRMLDRSFERITVRGDEPWPASQKSNILIDVVRSDPPARWVEHAARICLRKAAAGIVTAPLSKTGIAAAGLRDRGHTEIFARLSRSKNVYMAFWGRKFKVLLLTDHLPLMQVARRLTSERLRTGLKTALEFRRLGGSKKPIALVGLNPHAGESGLLGADEKRFATVLRNRSARGPLVPDTAFLPANWTKYSVFVCPYHDQGLIPFKLVHGFDEGVHLTLGLPFVRTSVDHGTAKDLFGRGLARHGSMRDAIELAIRLVRRRK